ncbi:hypothetical protein D3C80_1973290 [compost metagenome]
MNWSVSKIYNYVHFRSMPDQNAVIWLNSADEITDKIRHGLNTNGTLESAQNWFKIINQEPPEISSARIWKSIESILNR